MPISLRPRATRFGLALSIALPLLAPDAHAGWGPLPTPPPASETVPTPDAPAADGLGQGEPAPPVPVFRAVPAAETPAGVLSAADAALDAGDLNRARTLFGQLIKAYPTSTEAREARRALKVLTRAQTRPVAPASSAAPTDDATTTTPPPVVMRQEPYSTRTSERLRLTTWEKLDFGITAFLYGMSVGTSFAVAQDQSSPDVTGPLALGAIAYTLGAVGYLNLANPDRGDLPLALGITSYVPTTVLLVATVASPNARSSRIAWEVAGAGLLSVPIAIAVTRRVDLDPGDTQLVRDAGFWGLALATTGTLGFGGSSVNYGDYTSYSTPTNRQIASAGLLGLFGGLGLGILTATHTEISLERVRVTTWGGYGGALLGAMLGASSNHGNEKDTWAGLTIGALVGLTVTFATTGSLDGIPAESARLTAMNWSPTLLPLRDASGHTATALGFSGALP